MDAWISSTLANFTPGATGTWVVVAMLLAHFAREWRETRKLSFEDRLARRDGYARQVETLLNENRGLRAEMHQMNENHEAYRQICHQENDQLRTMLRHNADEIEGLKRKITEQGVELAKLIKPGRVR